MSSVELLRCFVLNILALLLAWQERSFGNASLSPARYHSPHARHRLIRCSSLSAFTLCYIVCFYCIWTAFRFYNLQARLSHHIQAESACLISSRCLFGTLMVA